MKDQGRSGPRDWRGVTQAAGSTFSEPRGTEKAEGAVLEPITCTSFSDAVKNQQMYSNIQRRKREGEKTRRLIKLAQQKCDHQAKTTRTRVSAKMQTQYLSGQETNADNRSKHTRRTKRKKGPRGRRKWRPDVPEHGRGRSQFPTSPV